MTRLFVGVYVAGLLVAAALGFFAAGYFDRIASLACAVIVMKALPAAAMKAARPR